MRTVAISLGKNPADSKVIVDGQDITTMCTGVELEAHIGEPTRITLFLIAHCELMADVPDVSVGRAEEEPNP